ncbi:uncharacterized protein LOC121379164 isoform X2 [Gigantopelta aegis]|nr:uncharacterized protein LOC121379164 isoform X2 [Gigantopelta aegis]
MTSLMKYLRKCGMVVLLSICITLVSTDDFEFPSTILPVVDREYIQLGSYQNDSSFIVKYCNVYCDGLLKRTTRTRRFQPIPWCLFCSCDEYCELFGDCCPDIHGHFRTGQPSDDSIKRHTCVQNSRDVKVMNNLYGIAMLLSCPGTIGSPDIEDIPGASVEDRRELAPVTSLVTNMSYYNQHIAKCNGENSFVLWDEEEDCSSGAGSGFHAGSGFGSPDDVDENVCQYAFYLKRGTALRLCDPIIYSEAVDTCNMSGLWIEFDPDLVTYCHSVYYPVGLGNTVYRNIFCFLCNGLKPRMVITGTKFLDGIPTFPRITILTRFKQWPVIDPFSEQTACKRNSLWDPAKKMCRQLYCRNGRILKNNECLPVSTDAFGDIYSFDVILRPRDHQTKNAAREWTLLTEIMMSYFQIKMSELRSTNYVFTFSVDSYLILRLSCKLLVTEHTDRMDLEERLLTLVSGEWETTFMGEYYLFASSISAENDYSFKDKATYWSDPVSGMCCNLVSNSFELKPLNMTLTPNTITVTENFGCPYVKLDAIDIVHHTSGWIELLYANVSLPKMHVSFFRSGEVGVCIDTLMTAYNGSGFDNISLEVDSVVVVQNMLSFICVTVSLLCLACTFLTYCVFPSLRTLPAKNNMFLIANLFLAQLLFQFGIGHTEHKLVCVIIGIVIHYQWLKVVLWMNVCSFHMFRVFVLTPGRPSCSLSPSNYILRYVAYTEVVSLLIIGVTVGVSMVISQGQDLGYGGHACYLSSPVRVGFAFVLPLSIVLCSNILFFAVTVYFISNTEQIERQTGKDRRNVYVYVKLSTLTGMFWTVSILSEYVDVEALSYIAIALNGSQGLLLFVCYALNRRVMPLWKGACTNIFQRSSRNNAKNTTASISV